MQDREPYLQELFDKPLETIQQDIFFRADNFKAERWYDEFSIYLRIGICQPLKQDALQVQKALKIMGYSTRMNENKGNLYIMPDIPQRGNTDRKSKNKEDRVR